MPVNKQLSFAAGEVNPAIYGRLDLQKFDSACRILLNMIVHVEGGASNRTGLEFIGAVHDSSETTRLIKFRFNTEQTYILEFSDFFFRVIKDQAYVMNTAVNITAITKANPCEVTIGSHSLVVGQEVFISSVGGMTELNSIFFRINSVTATTITLEDIFGTNINSTSFTTYTSGGTVEAIPIFATFWPQADLAKLKFAQNADTLTVVHTDHNTTYNITRTDHDVWTVTAVDFTPGIVAPSNFTATPATASGAQVRNYVVTAIDDTTGEESIASTPDDAINDLSVTANSNDLTWSPVTNAKKYNVYSDDNQSGVFGFIGNVAQKEETATITGATQANPGVITIGAHTYAIDMKLVITGVVGMTELNGNTYLVNSIAATTITLKTEAGVAVDTSGFGAYISGGSAAMSLVNEFEDIFIAPDYDKTPPETRSPVFVSENFVITGATQADPCVLTITAGDRTPAVGDQVDVSAVVGMTELNGNTYFVKAATSTTIDLEDKEGTSLDSSGFTAYSSAGVAKVSEQNNSPRCVTYHQQRRAYAGPDNNPSTFFTSRTGLFDNMNVSAITQADDAITFNVVADDVNEIRDMKSQKDLFLFTSSGVWRMVTGENLAFTVDNITADEQESWGVSDVRVIKVGQSFLYVQDGERVVRDLQDTLESVSGFTGDELTLLAKHMFKERKIVEWAYARDPDSIIWCVMDDGTVNALTYLRKHQIWAWTHHTTDGLFKSVETIPETTSEYGVYFVVERTIVGTTGSTSTMRYVERLKNRDLLDIKDSFFVDSGLTLDSPKTISGATKANPVVITATAHGFSDADLIDHSDIKGMTELNGNRYKIGNKATNTYELFNEIGDTETITAATKAAICEITIGTHTHTIGQQVIISGVVGMTELNGNTYLVQAVTATTILLKSLAGVNLDSTGFTTYVSGGVAIVDVNVDGSAFTAYIKDGKARKAVTTVSGLEHLEGESVSVLADGGTAHNPLDSNLTTKTVSGASITIANAASRIHVGLPFTSDLETIGVDLTSLNGLGDAPARFKSNPFVKIRVQDSVGFRVGPNVNELEPYKPDGVEANKAQAFINGVTEKSILPDWNHDGTVFVRQIDPLPMSILTIMPEADVVENP